MYIYDKEYFYKTILRDNEENVKAAIMSKNNQYKVFFIDKKNGKRKICSVIKGTPMHSMQVELKKFFDRIPISPVAKGFVKGEGYLHFLYPHISKKYFMRIDIKDFFGTIHDEKIYESLKSYCRYDDIIFDIIGITTLGNELPQGAITSPVLSNIVFSKVDQRILKYCQSLINVSYDGKNKSNEVVYTRYADDLLFSSDYIDFKKCHYFKKVIKTILTDSEYKVNYDKLKYGYERISLSGYVVCNDVHLSRSKLKELKRILLYFDGRNSEKGYEIDIPYYIEENKVSDNVIEGLNLMLSEIGGKTSRKFGHIYELVDYLCGYRSFLISINIINERKGKTLEQNIKLIQKIEVLVKKLSNKFGV